MKINHVAGVALAFAICAPAAAAPITYTGVQQVGASSAALTIVTDGTIGALTSANIVSVSASLTNGATTVLLLRDIATGTGNAGFVLSASLQATASSLVLPYVAGAANNEFGLYGPSGFQNWYEAGQGSVFSFSPQRSIKLGDDVASTALAGDLVLGTAAAAVDGVPEPAAWGLLLLGFGGMGHVLRRRTAVRTRIRFA